MSGPTRDVSARDDGPLHDDLFWDAPWTLDDEWHPDGDAKHGQTGADSRQSGSASRAGGAVIRQSGSASRSTPPATSWSTGTTRVAVPKASPAPKLRA